MARMSLLGPALAFSAALLAEMAAAQADMNVRSPGGTRPFAQPLYWLNMTPDDRLPIRERLLLPQVGLTGMAPPASRRSGLTPWVSGAMESIAGNTEGDPVLTFAPGLSYRLDRSGLSFSAGYAVEAAVHAERSDLNRLVQGHGGFASLSYTLSPRTQITLFDVFSDTRDIRDAVLQAAVSEADRLVSNTLVAGLRHAPDRRSLIELGYLNSVFLIDAPDSEDLYEQGLTAGYQLALGETASLSARAAVSRFDFSSAPGATRLMAEAGYTRDLGPQLALSFGLGVVHSDQDSDHTRLRYRGEIVHSRRFALFSLAAVGDIVAVPGLRNLASSDEITAAALLRLGPGLMLDLSMGVQRLGVLDPDRTDVSVLLATGTLSYALNDDLWLWTRLELNSERSGGITGSDNRLAIGLSRNLGP